MHISYASLSTREVCCCRFVDTKSIMKLKLKFLLSLQGIFSHTSIAYTNSKQTLSYRDLEYRPRLCDLQYYTAMLNTLAYHAANT